MSHLDIRTPDPAGDPIVHLDNGTIMLRVFTDRQASSVKAQTFSVNGNPPASGPWPNEPTSPSNSLTAEPGNTGYWSGNIAAPTGQFAIKAQAIFLGDPMNPLTVNDVKATYTGQA